MSARSPEEVLDDLLAISPLGLFPAARDSGWGTHLLPIATLYSEAEQRFQTMLPQVDPRNAQDPGLLPDFERVIGPDPLGRDETATTLAKRQVLAYQRWVFTGGCSPQFYIDLAASLGVVISIEEFLASQTGDTVCGDVLAPPDDELTWRITMPSTLVEEAITGATVCGDPLGQFVDDPLPALIRLYAQPHTLPVFTLSGTQE